MVASAPRTTCWKGLEIGYILVFAALAVWGIYALFQLAIFLRLLRSAELKPAAANPANGASGSAGEGATGA